MPAPDTVRRFGATELRRFFTAVDAHLTKDAALIVLGGSAIALYGAPVGTRDIDTYETDLGPLRHAIARAREVTGLDIPVAPAGVADAPWDFQDRLQPEQGGWAHLTVFKLEPHDLALSKAVRGVESDFAAIVALHSVSPLDRETLITRYLEEMGHAIGDQAQRDAKFAILIERLYGEAEAEHTEKRLRAHRRRARPR